MSGKLAPTGPRQCMCGAACFRRGDRWLCRKCDAALVDDLAALEAKCAQLEAQRDELVAACCAALISFEEAHAHRKGGNCECDLIRRAITNARKSTSNTNKGE